jgi:hypothetical protein
LFPVFSRLMTSVGSYTVNSVTPDKMMPLSGSSLRSRKVSLQLGSSKSLIISL